MMLVFILCSCEITSILGGSKFTFTEDGDAYKFSGIGDSKDTEIVIPDTYKNKPVTSIGDKALYFNLAASLFTSEEVVYITSVTLPDSITKIGNEAFANNPKLESVNIPDGVTSIGEGAFYNCASLTSITIPDGVTEIKDFTFAECSNLKTITIPESVTKIGRGAFSGCNSLETVVLPDGVTEISAKCFEKCNSLKDFTISENIDTIGDYAFSNCKSLGKMTVPTTVTTMGECVFNEVGEGVEISVCYDNTAPEDWNEKWYFNMLGGKALNTSEVYYNNVVVPNIAQAAVIEAQIAACHESYKSLQNQIGYLNQASWPYQESGNAEMIRYYRDEINACKDQQRSILNQIDDYEEQLKALHTTNQING